MIEATKSHEFFHAMIKDAKVKSLVENKMTLTLQSEARARHFEKIYKARFEELASKIFGEKIIVNVEVNK